MDAARIIRFARAKSGLSIWELAQRAKTSSAAIVKYESGKTSPSVETLNQILRAAGWAAEVNLFPVSSDLVARGEMMVELLEIVDLVEIKTAEEYLQFPRFQKI
jgi:transcriptional regulator with XRE-family HTH domain